MRDSDPPKENARQHRPRVLLTNFHPHGGGGHVTFMTSLLDSDLRQTFQFAVASPPGSRFLITAQETNITAFPCHFPGHLREIRGILQAMRRFQAICTTFQPEIIHTNGSRDHAIACWWKRWQNSSVRIIRTHHAIRQLTNSAYNRWRYNVATNQHTYVCHSARNISWAGKALQPTSHEIIENRVDLDYYQPMLPDPGLREQLGIKPERLVFGSCAGLGRYKRVDLILEAAKRLKDHDRFHILVLGNTQAGEHLLATAQAAGLEDVLVYGGFQKDVRPYNALMHVGFILSDTIETISFAAREMMAMGLPLISSTFSGLLENVDHGLDGFLVRPSHVEDIVEAMRYFLEMDAEQLRAMRANARSKAVRRFDARQTIAQWQKTYEILLK